MYHFFLSLDVLKRSIRTFAHEHEHSANQLTKLISNLLFAYTIATQELLSITCFDYICTSCKNSLHTRTPSFLDSIQFFFSVWRSQRLRIARIHLILFILNPQNVGPKLRISSSSWDLKFNVQSSCVATTSVADVVTFYGINYKTNVCIRLYTLLSTLT